MTAGSICRAPVGQVDLLATVSDLLEVQLASEAAPDSESFLAELLGHERPRAPLMHHGRGRFALREGDWKLIFTKNGLTLGEPVELYDLARDPAETRNRIEDFPQLAKRLQALAVACRR